MGLRDENDKLEDTGAMEKAVKALARDYPLLSAVDAEIADAPTIALKGSQPLAVKRINILTRITASKNTLAALETKVIADGRYTPEEIAEFTDAKTNEV